MKFFALDSLIDWVEVVAFITNFLALVPQAIKVYFTRSARDVSIIGMINSLICGIAWLIYGILMDDITVWGSNISLILSAAYVIAFKFMNEPSTGWKFKHVVEDVAAVSK